MKRSNPRTELEKALQDAGLTKTEFAKKIGVKYGSVMGWCSGEVTPNEKNIEKITEVLGFCPIVQQAQEDETPMKKALREAGITPREFSRKIGITDNSVYKWLNGKSAPSYKSARKIEEILGFCPIVRREREQTQEQEQDGEPPIKKALREAGITPKEFAKKLGTYNQVVYGWMNGKKAPGYKFSAKIEEILGFLPEGCQVSKHKNGKPTERGEILRKMRTDAGLSYSEIARRIGNTTSFSSVSVAEKDANASVSLYLMRRVAKACGVSLADYGIDDKPKKVLRYAEIGLLVKKWREETAEYSVHGGLKRANDALGLSKSCLASIERGASIPSNKLIEQMIKIYGSPPQELWEKFYAANALKGKWIKSEKRTKNKRSLQDKILYQYKKGRSIRTIGNKLGIGWQKVTKILVSNGICPNETSAAVQRLSNQGKTKEEICEELKISKKVYDAYMPYTKCEYRSENRTKNAMEIEKCRKRKKEREMEKITD